MHSYAIPLLHTKLHRPPLPTGAVCRDRLVEVLGDGLALPLTVVSAPAGYGKSTLVSQWVESLDEPSAWLSLDYGDSDLKTFLSYFLAALETAVPDACAESLTLSESTNPVPVTLLGTTLANELDAIGSRLVLVLDDFHRIDPASDVHELLRILFDHPPRSLRLVLISRSDPPLLIPLLRGRGQVVEIRLKELKFTPSECALYLSAAGIKVSDEALVKLGIQTEGWIVALLLVVLHLRQVDDPEAALRNLEGGVQQTNEYLLHEVLALLPSLTREWLLKTAVLDRFCPELCAAVAGSSAGAEEPTFDGVEFVRTLNEGNLFIIPLDLQGHWFRYHHLFRDMLHEQLEVRAAPGEIAALHEQASEWFEGEGLIDEALKHALAAENIDLAVGLVTRHRHALLNADKRYVLGNWLSLMSETVVQQHAELLMARAWTLIGQPQFETLFSLLDRLESLITNDPAGESLRGEISLLRGYALFFMGEGGASLKYTTEALKRIPLRHYQARAHCELIFALSSQMVGMKQQALHSLDELLTQYDSPEELRKTRLLGAYVFIQIIDADLTEAELANGRLRAVADRGGYPFTLAWTDHLQGLIHLQRGEWDAAAGFLEKSVAQRFIHLKRTATDSMVSLMLVRQAQGREAEARSTLEMLQDYAATQDDTALWPLVGSAESRLATMQGQPELARAWLESFSLPAEPAALWWLDVPSVTRCRVLIAAGSAEELASAEALLQADLEVNKAHHNKFQPIQIFPLLALLFEKQGRTAEAITVLGKALALAQPGGLVFPFLELGAPMMALLARLPRDSAVGPFIEQLLEAGPGAEAPADTGSKQPEGSAPDLLTDREQQIVELLAQRLQYKEIAARLSISPQTVNSHLKNAYQKLGVSNRRRAVARALELDLLSST